jgi:hypothetical protein
MEGVQQRHHHPYLEYVTTSIKLTVGAFAKGVYPEIEEYSALVQPASYDSLEPTFSKPNLEKLLIARVSPSWSYSDSE